MEAHVTFEADGVTLEGLLGQATPAPPVGVVLCHPHPLYGGDMHNNVVSALATALQVAGLTTLRFNFRGVGQSGGRHGEGVAEGTDVQAAVSYLLSRQDVPRVAVVGYSFGALVGLRAGAQDDRVQALVGVALPVARREATFLLQAAKPTLLISGDRDDYSPLPTLQKLVDGLPAPGKLVTLAGADHFFWGREGEVAQAAVAFLTSR